jgi:serine/threonine-protein kinase
MDYIEGESLRDRLNREHQLSIEDTIGITRQVADALDFAHARDVVHRDIKPENILVTGDRAWVADFGIARAVTVAGGEQLTKTGMAVGTPVYMSPEQALASKDLTSRSDIYSLGCVVYEMLAGGPPFSAASPTALMAKHSLEDAPRIRVVRQSVSEEIEAAILCALDKTPADRFRTAGDFSKALTGELPVATPARRAKAGMATARFSRRAIAIGSAALVLATAGGAVAWWRAINGSPTSTLRAGSDTDPTRVAVLYFEDMSPRHDLGYLADGLTEALIQQLSDVRQLRVISRNGVRSFKARADATPDSVGRALKIGTVVTGNVSTVRERIRVDVSLVDALTNSVIGHVRVEQPRDSVLALQDDVAGDVAAVLRKQLGEEIRTRESRRGTRNDRAWAAMERAKLTVAAADPLVSAGNVQAGSRQLQLADAELAAVEQLDAKWVAPIVQRGWLAYRTSRLVAPNEPSRFPKLLADGLSHAERALALSPTDADALELRATIRYLSWLNNLAPDPRTAGELLDGAERDLTSATVANPLQATAWNTLSHLLLAKGRISEAKIAADRAYDADPYLTDIDRTIWRRFQASLDLGDRAESTKACELGRRRFPDNFRFTECRLWLYGLEGPKPNAPEIWATYDEYLKRSPANVAQFNALKGKMIVALGLVRAGLTDSARSLAVATQSTAGPEVDPNSELINLRAIVHARIATANDKTVAIQLLARYLAMNPQQAGAASEQDEAWWTNSLKGDPRYVALFKH